MAVTYVVREFVKITSKKAKYFLLICREIDRNANYLANHTSMPPCKGCLSDVMATRRTSQVSLEQII